MPQVRTRFAPSPTGYMHIGGMRTALFCWLWARHTGGKFILRIDDTDQQRNVEAALEPIYRAFRWLGLEWDEGPQVGGEFGPYFQSQRTALYQAAADQLLARGLAFRDFDPPELTQADRQAAEADKRTFLNVRRSLELTEPQIQARIAAGDPYVVRFIVPRTERIAIDDAVRGHVEWDCSLIADPVILRSNGAVLYNFATVVDDAQLQISHIIRAEEHLTNTAVQALLHRALGNPPPVFAHIPFITAPGSTKKLSKRDLDKLRKSPTLKKMFDRADEIFPLLGLGDSISLNPVMVEYYERLGYLPEAIFNALSRLGWSLDDKTEFLSREQVVEHFTLERIVKSPAGFDPDKLLSFQTHWMAQLPTPQKVAGVASILRQAGWLDADGLVVPLTSRHPTPSGSMELPAPLPVTTQQFLEGLIGALGDRLKVFTDVLDAGEFFQPDDGVLYDPVAFSQKLQQSPEAQGLLQEVRDLLAASSEWQGPALEQAVQQWLTSRGLKFGQIVHALRVALTGRTVGLGLFDAIALIGREGTLKRIDRALELAAQPTT